MPPAPRRSTSKPGAVAEPGLILASSSPYKRQLLARLRLPFAVRAPDFDERALIAADAGSLARRLALGKAATVAMVRPDDWVIGADQVAELDGSRLDKPGNPEAQRGQLWACRGKTVRFHTAVCLLRQADRALSEHVDLTEVRFRHLSETEIDRYVAREPAFDCAGGFKCEGLGIGLFESIDNRDPSALIGLPLIALAGMLREAGFPVP